MKKMTKEDLVEMMGLAELLEAKLRDAGLGYRAEDVSAVASSIRWWFNEVCGEEELARMREQGIKD